MDQTVQKGRRAESYRMALPAHRLGALAGHLALLELAEIGARGEKLAS